MRDYPQFEDLGLDPESDRTEDLRPGHNKTAPVDPVLPAPAGTARTHLNTHEESE